MPRAKPPVLPAAAIRAAANAMTASAATERIVALAGFLAAIAPGVAVPFEGFQSQDDHADDAVIAARDSAVVAAFNAVERLARGDG